jgi:gas vesicle protein
MRTTHESVLPLLLIGVSLGVLAGFLWAPRAGKQMRDELHRGANDGLDFLSEEAEKVRAGTDRWLGKIKERFVRPDKTARRAETFGQTSENE